MILMDEEEARCRVRERVNDRQWWIIPWVSDGSARISELVEETHYDGDANADFETMLGGFGGITAITFAHKRHMDRKHYARLLAKVGVGDEKTLQKVLRTQDIVVAMTGPDDEQTVALVYSFHAWVMGDDGWQPMKNLN